MKLSELVQLYGKNMRVMNLITEDDIESILRNSYHLSKSNFSEKDWDQLLSTCSKRIRKFTVDYETTKTIIEPEIEGFISEMMTC